ncbi:O-antigen ligase family protein [Mycolicibacterium sp.]|uniref:O-antigen ligase family protein n=1 Tax=Mycolicibacterium sp. TaxID=2320850 RepID=UPI001A2FD83C|nr:O-antigen ligase family protein [Mycolicibacterium sp.]MBJ7339113.1 O-antigen ligase family protein [Mycolicibacterium sp.]
MSRAAIGCLLLAGLTVTWTGLKLPGLGDPADILIAAAFGLCAVMVVFGDLRFAIPLWPFIPPIAVIACVLARQLDPPPYYLQVLRYQFGTGAPSSLVKALFWLFALLVVPLTIMACIAIDRRVAVWTMAAYVSGTAVSSGVAIVDLTGLTNIGRSLPGNLTYLLTNTTVDTSNRIPGLSDHPNNLAFTATLSIPVVVYFMGTMRRRWIATILLIALLGGVLASGSRGAQAVAPVVLVVSVLWLPRRPSGERSNASFFWFSALAAGVLGVAVLISLPSKIRESILRITSIESIFAQGNASNDGRLTLLGTGLLDWRQYPIFGAGLRHIVEAHNIYVQLLASGGLVLLIAMFAYWLLMIRDCWRLSRIGVHYARFLMLSIIGWLVLGSVENQLTERGIYFAVGCIAGLASIHFAHWPEAPEDEAPGRGHHDALHAGLVGH